MQIVTCLHPDSPIKTAILRDDGSIVCQTNINQTDGEFAVVDPPLKNVLQIAVNPTGLWGLNTALLAPFLPRERSNVVWPGRYKNILLAENSRRPEHPKCSRRQSC